MAECEPGSGLDNLLILISDLRFGDRPGWAIENRKLQIANARGQRTGTAGSQMGACDLRLDGCDSCLDEMPKFALRTENSPCEKYTHSVFIHL